MRLELFLSIFILFLLHRFSRAQNDASATCKELESTSALIRLHKYLFCDYDSWVRPTIEYRNATAIQFGIIPEFFEFNEDSNSIDLHAWTFLMWKDPHLIWEPQDYDGMKLLHVKNYEIWVPDLAVHSPGSAVSEEMPLTDCWLSHTGSIYCVPQSVYTGHCDIDYSWWPYDSGHCTINFASWSYTTKEVQFEYRQTEQTMENYVPNPSWDLLKTYITQRTGMSKHGDQLNTDMMSYNILIKRHGSRLAAIYIVPVTVLILVTLLTLWLESRSGERMIVANLNFILHFLMLYDLHWKLPHNGNRPVKLLVLCEWSAALSCFALLATSLLRQIQEYTKDPPGWISSSAVWILQSKAGQILMISVLDPKVSARIDVNSDDNLDLVASNKKSLAWQYVAILLGWAAFFGVFIIYMIILGYSLVPMSGQVGFSNS